MYPNAVFFDLGNTLVSYYKKEDFLPVLEKSMRNCLYLLSAQGKNYDFDRVLEKAIAQDPGRADHGVTPIEERLEAVFGKSDIEHQLPELVRVFMEPVFTTARIMDGSIELLQTLQNKGIPMLLMSNTPWGSPSDLWRSHLNELRLDKYFQEMVFCVDVGWRKPHEKIFHYALDKMHLSADEVVFVGDDPEWDIAGARNVGIRAELATGDNDQLLSRIFT